MKDVENESIQFNSQKLNGVFTLKIDMTKDKNQDKNGTNIKIKTIVYLTNTRDGSVKRLVFDKEKPKENKFYNSESQSSDSNDQSNELFNAFKEHNKENANFINKQSCPLPPKYFINQTKPQAKRQFTAREIAKLDKALNKDFVSKKKFITRKKSQLRAHSKKLEKKLDKKVIMT